MSRIAKIKLHKKRKYTPMGHLCLGFTVAIAVVFLYILIAQQVRLVSIRKETARCQEEIAIQEKEYQKLEEKAAYSSSERFYEEKARDEGYVKENETIFIVGN